MIAALLFLALSAASPDAQLDAPLVPGAASLAERGRYRSPRSFDDTLDFYERTLNQAGAVRWRSIVNLPGIRAKHIESLRKKTRWEGINIYEYKGEVRFYVIPRSGNADAASDKTKQK